MNAGCECGACYTCRKRAYNRAWRAANPDQCRVQGKKARAKIKADPERLAAQRARERKRKNRKRIENPAAALEIERAYRAANPEKFLEYSRKHSTPSPYPSDEALRVKARARQCVKYALKTGKLVRQPCEVCGEARTHAHHDDYAKPLEVRWLCSIHHGRVHWKVA